MYAAEDIAANGPQLRSFNWSNCRHHYVERVGLDKAGRQRWWCGDCHEYFSAKRSRHELLVRSLAESYREGLSEAVAARVAVCAKSLAHRWFLKFRRRGYEPRKRVCGCGRTLPHAGMCRAKQKTTARTTAMAIASVSANG